MGMGYIYVKIGPHVQLQFKVLSMFRSYTFNKQYLYNVYNILAGSGRNEMGRELDVVLDRV